GMIRAPGKKPGERISEIELELKSGPVTALYDVALRLLAEAPVRLEWRSKAERGYRLAEGHKTTEAARAEPLTLDPALSAEALLLGLMRWFDGNGWRDAEHAHMQGQPIGNVAPLLLDKLRRTVKRRSKGFARQPSEERHKLRIALKKLRYTAELLGGLYDAPALEKFTARLKRLQDDLGDANDVRAAQGIIAGLTHGRDGATIARAGKIVLDWHHRRLVER